MVKTWGRDCPPAPPVPTALHKDVVYYQMQPYKVDLDLGVFNTPNTNLMQLCRAGALCDIIPWAIVNLK